MNILDEDIGQSQRRQLEAWRIHCRQIGVTIGRASLKDQEGILPLLHRLKHPTFFTLDHGFYRPTVLRQGYCLVFLDVWEDEVAVYVRRFLRHPQFRARSQRMGKIVRIRHSGVTYRQVHVIGERMFIW